MVFSWIVQSGAWAAFLRAPRMFIKPSRLLSMKAQKRRTLRRPYAAPLPTTTSPGRIAW